MLVLTRKPSQSILIGDDIIVKVIEIRGGQIRLGIEAPENVTVLREELRRPKENSEEAGRREPHAC
ncbi:MAG: carbon storage regulator CsrA [Clostridia bacterium 62_21]|nr:MAG: carbon storage regulator CsrA [Clostridia bacterium 62_21]